VTDRSAGWVIVIILVAWLLILIGITGTATYRFSRFSNRFGLAKRVWQTRNRPGAASGQNLVALDMGRPRSASSPE
jgi:hypothetical protein